MASTPVEEEVDGEVAEQVEEQAVHAEVGNTVHAYCFVEWC